MSTAGAENEPRWGSLKILDDEMVRAGARTTSAARSRFDETEGMGLTEVLLSALAA